MIIADWNGEPHSAEELTRKFSGTYIKASFPIKEGERLIAGEFLTYIHRITNPMLVEGVYYQSPDPKKGRTFAIDGKAFNVVSCMPKSGVYDLDREAVLVFRRVPARQWHEGCYLGNSEILINGSKPVEKAIAVHHMWALFSKQEDLTLEEARRLLKPGKSIRINNKYWLKDDGAKKIDLMRFTGRIGSWAVGTFFFASSASCLKEELKDELNFHA